MSFTEMLQTYGVFFLVGQYPRGPLGGLALTLLLAVAALLLALPLGLLLGLARVSARRALRWPVTALVFVVRGTPLLMVVFWAYFFLPGITGIRTSRFVTMLLALTLFDGAYLAEIVGAGLQGLPPGQSEAARALGLSRGQALRHVLLPQALRNMLPSLINQLVATVKETSLGYIIGLTELSQVATQINTLVFVLPAQIYACLALCYFLLCFSLSRLALWVERRHATSRAPSGGRLASS